MQTEGRTTQTAEEIVAPIELLEPDEKEKLLKMWPALEFEIGRRISERKANDFLLELEVKRKREEAARKRLGLEN